MNPIICKELEKYSFEYASLWSEFHREKEECVYDKFHLLLGHGILFLLKHEMLGILSEEGFEAVHPQMNKICNALSSMVCTSKRVHKHFHRIMIGLKTEFNKARSAFDINTNGKKRGNYRKEGIARAADTGLVADNLSTSEIHPGIFTVWSTGHIVKIEWQECFEYVCCGRAPKKVDQYISQGRFGKCCKDQA